MTMTPEEWLGLIGQSSQYRDKGKARLNRAAMHYRAYLAAYGAKTRVELLDAESTWRTSWSAVRLAAQDRDEGRPMRVVEGCL